MQPDYIAAVLCFATLVIVIAGLLGENGRSVHLH